MDYLPQITKWRDENTVTRHESYELEPNELWFILEYLVDFDHIRAYSTCFSLRELGGPVDSESKKLLKSPRIRQALFKEINAQAEHLIITKNTLMDLLWDIAVDITGQKTSSRLKAIEMLGKMTGSLEFEDKTPPPSVNVTISSNENSEVEVSNGSVSQRAKITRK